MIIKVGEKYRWFCGEGNPNNKTIHIRAIVDSAQIVYKQWSRRKQYWVYVVVDDFWFDINAEYLKKVK